MMKLKFSHLLQVSAAIWALNPNLNSEGFIFFLLSHAVSGVSSYALFEFVTSLSLSCIIPCCSCLILPVSAQLWPAFTLSLLTPSPYTASALLASPSGYYSASSLSLQDPRRPFQAPCLIVPWFFICSLSQLSLFDNSSAHFKL